VPQDFFFKISHSVLQTINEAPRSKLRGIKAEFAEANPPSLFELRRVAMPFIPAASYRVLWRRRIKKQGHGDPISRLSENISVDYPGKAFIISFACPSAAIGCTVKVQ
jgi:hypothetical protein